VYVIVAQLLAFFRCLEEGLQPDSPSEGGIINRRSWKNFLCTLLREEKETRGAGRMGLEALSIHDREKSSLESSLAKVSLRGDADAMDVLFYSWC